MHPSFLTVNIQEDFDSCVEARRETHLSSFGTTDTFAAFLDGYRERMTKRISRPEWFYIHIWVGDEIAGQLEFRSVYNAEGTGYVHLMYLKSAYRGTGLAKLAHNYILETLRKAGCHRAILSVSRTNERAVQFYKRNGWVYLSPNPKRETTDFYEIWFSA